MAGQAGSTKKTRGRQKIEIKPITGTETRLVTFSKRKSGIIKKATELSNLCGAEVGIVIYSPAGKAFAFGSPSIEHVSDRFLNKGTVAGPSDRVSRIIENHRRMRLENLTNRHNELKERLQAALDKNKYLKKVSEAVQRGNLANNVKPQWWEVPVDQSGHGQLAKMDRLYDALSDYLDTH